MDRFKILRDVEPPQRAEKDPVLERLCQIIDQVEPLPEIKEQTRLCRGWVPGDGCGSGRCGETPCTM